MNMFAMTGKIRTSALRVFLAGVFALAGASYPSAACARELLRILAWSGYADPDIVAEFEKKADVRIQVSYVNSDDELSADAAMYEAKNSGRNNFQFCKPRTRSRSLHQTRCHKP